MDLTTLIIVGAIVLVTITVVGILSRYRKCKSDELLVVYGKTGSHKESVQELGPKGNPVTREVEIKTARVYHGGAAFVWPIIQGYEVMSMRPIQLNLTLKDALSAQNIRVTVPTTVTVAISQDPIIMQNAANRLLGVDDKDKENLISDIVYGQMRLIVASMEIEELNSNRDKFLTQARDNINTELNKLGLYLININISDIRDAANYIENLGQKETTKAKAQAEAAIAEEEKKGAIQIATTTKERETKVAETTREQKIAIATTLKDQETTIAETNKEKAVKLAETEKDKSVSIAKATKEQQVQLAEQIKEQEIAIAEQRKEKEVGVAVAQTEEQSKVAEQEALKVAALAKAQAEADSKRAAAAAEAAANVAKSEAEADSKKAEAEAQKQIRIAKAKQEQEAETIKATQEKEAKTAEYESDARQRAAEAEKAAGVAEHTATIEVSKAKGNAAKAAAEAEKVAGTSKVEAEMAVAKTKQERQVEVNEAAAKAEEAKLKAEIIVPAETQKQKVTIEAEAIKAKAILEAEAKAAEIMKEAEAKANATKMQLEAEAEGTRKKLLAEAEGKEASLMAEAKQKQAMEMAPAMAVEKMIESGMTPEFIVQYAMTDKWKEVAEANAKVFEHIQLGNVTVYGGHDTAGKFMAETANQLAPALEIARNLPIASSLKQIFTGKAPETDKANKDGFEAVK